MNLDQGDSTVKKLALAVCLLVLVSVAGTGCVSQTHADDQHQTIRTLREQIIELQARLEQKDDEIASLRGQIGTDAAMRDKLEQAIADRERYQSLLADALRKLEQQDTVVIGLPPEVSDQLAELAAQNPGLMTYDAKRGMIRFSSDLTFDLGKTDVKPAAVDSLTQLAAIINSQVAQPYNVRIEGHTDNVPVKNAANVQKYEDNWGLSAFRAKSVMHVLERAGVGSQRMIISGRGEHVPLVPNVATTGARANRRVEVYLVPRSNFDAPGPAPRPNNSGIVEQPLPEEEGPEIFK